VQETETRAPVVSYDQKTLRTLRDSTRTNAVRRALTATEQRTVVDVIAFFGTAVRGDVERALRLAAELWYARRHSLALTSTARLCLIHYS